MKTLFNKYGIFVLIALFSIVYSFISVIKHNHFQTGLDFGIYVQTFWSYINLKLPKVTFYPTYGDLVWSDHFTPSLVLLAPFYYLWPNPNLLLILQSTLFVIGVYPIFLFCQDKTKNIYFSYVLAFAYLIFFGTQFALTFDFHSATYSAIFLPWLLYFLFYKRWKLFIVFLLLFIGGKEDAPLIASAIGLFLFFSNHNRRLGLIVFICSFLYLIVVTKYLMPSMSEFGAKIYTTPEFPKNIFGFLAVTFDSYTKNKTIFLSLASFIFLPLLSGWFALIPFIHFFTNFISRDFMGRWDIYLHYRVQLGAILSYASVLGYLKFVNFYHKPQSKKIISYLLPSLFLVCIIAMDYFLHLPLNTLFKPQFYKTEQWMLDNFHVISKVPNNAYVLTQNNLAPHLANREKLYYFPKNIDQADYILLDMRPGQLIINHWLSGEEKDINTQINQLINNQTFYVYYRSGDAILLKKNKQDQ
jgi:uncharacterized membrane protein